MVDRWRLDESFAEVRLGEGPLAGEPAGLVELRLGHVDADRATVRTGGVGGEEAVHARAAAEVEDGLAGLDGGEVEEVADAGERVDGWGGDAVEVGGRVAQALGERAAGLEVEPALGLECDLLVHALDALLELGRVELADLGARRRASPQW